MHLHFLTGIAAQLLRLRTGKAYAASGQNSGGVHLRVVFTTAQTAGHPQAEFRAVGLDLQFTLPARTADTDCRGLQGEHAAAAQHRFAAFGADISKTAYFLHM